MSRKITLETIIAKLDNKDMFFQSRADKETIAALSIIRSLELFEKGLGSVIALNTISDYVKGDLDIEEFKARSGLDLDENSAILLQEQKALIDTKHYLYPIAELNNEGLAILDYNVKYANYINEWCNSPSKNGKPNIYSILKEAGMSPFTSGMSWLSFLIKEPLKNSNGSKLTKQAFFEKLKKSILEGYMQRVENLMHEIKTLQEKGTIFFEEKGIKLDNEVIIQDAITRHKKVIENLQLLTWEIISDRHTLRPVKEQVVFTDYAPIGKMAVCTPLDWIGALTPQGKHSEATEFDAFGVAEDRNIILYDNTMLKATTTLPKGIDNIGKFTMLTDKLLVVLRTELINSRDVNKVQSEAEVTISIHNAMRLLGYSAEEIENRSTKSEFYTRVKQVFELWYCTTFECKTGNKTKFRLISAYDKENIIRVVFTMSFLELQKLQHAFEHYPRALLTIPNNKVAEYYLARKFCNYNTNKNNIGAHIENRLSVKALFNDLDEKRALAGTDTTRHTNRRKITRFLQALNWLQDNGYLKIKFYDSADVEIDLKSSDYYTDSIAHLEELMTCFIVPQLTSFIENNRQEFEARLTANREKAKETKRKQAQRKTKKEKKKAIADSVQEQVVEASESEEKTMLEAFTV